MLHNIPNYPFTRSKLNVLGTRTNKIKTPMKHTAIITVMMIVLVVMIIVMVV